MNSKILLVEDNAKILEANRQVLAHEGYEVMTAETLAQARLVLKQSPPDLIVLDIKLPDGNGLDFLTEIREQTTAPVLILSALKKWEQRLEGIRKGGDDYITKPYLIEELRERVAALLRRVRLDTENHISRTVERGALTLDVVSARAFLSGEDMLLSQKEFALLMLLMQNEGKTFSKDFLYEEVWKQPMVGEDRSLRKHLSRLRGKLSGSGYTISVTYGEGYCFEKSDKG